MIRADILQVSAIRYVRKTETGTCTPNKGRYSVFGSNVRRIDSIVSRINLNSRITDIVAITGRIQNDSGIRRGIRVGNDVFLAGSQRRYKLVDLDRLVDLAFGDSRHGSDLVAGVVRNEDRHGSADVGGNVEGVGDRLTFGGLLGHDALINRIATDIHQSQIGDIVVVLRLNGDGAVRIFGHGQELGRLIVVGEGSADHSTVAEKLITNQRAEPRGSHVAGGRIGIQINAVILGDREEACGDLVAVGQIQSGSLDVEGRGCGIRILPRLLIHIVPGTARIVVRAAGVKHRAVFLDSGSDHGAGVTDQVILRACKRRIRADRQSVLREGRLHGIGVAGELHRRIAVIADVQIVHVGKPMVGRTGGSVKIINVTISVEHGRIRPGAVNAEDRD